MKKLIIPFLLAALPVSCSKSGKGADPVAQPEVTTATASVPAVAAALAAAFTPPAGAAAVSDAPAPTAPAPRMAQRPPAADATPTSPYRIPKKDTNLPSAEQLAEGAASSIGAAGGGASRADTQPSATVKPPKPRADDLAPGE